MVKIPSKLHLVVQEKYDAALKAGSIIFSETSLAIIRTNNIPVRV